MPNRQNMHYTHGSFFIKALNNLVGSGNYYLEGDDRYESVKEWRNGVTPPTAEQVYAERDRLKSEWERTAYARERKYDYPDFGELADAIYWKEKGDNSKMQAYIAKIDAIKAQWPKS
jgi:hypothetical protein